MAGGGVGEAMLIGAAMGAGTGAVTSAIDKKDPLQGALMGAVSGAAMGGIGSALGGGATAATEQLGEKAVEQGVQKVGEQGVNAAAQSAAQTSAMQDMTRAGLSFDQQANIIQGAQGTVPSSAGGQAMTQAGMDFGQQQGIYNAFQPAAQAPAQAPTGGAAQWMAGGKGTGFAPELTNAQAYGAAGTGGISGIYAAQNLPSTEPFPTQPEDSYSGPLSYFKYDPEKYKVNTPEPNVYQARYSMADGGIASLTQDRMSPMSNPVYPQSQQQHTNFASSPQMPNSMRSAMASDYDTRTNPSLGTELPMGYADGGGIADLGSYSDGGRLLRGPGDGVSDSIPATIAGKQPARLADGEFVVPSRIVSELGNGSTDAGARRLYDMMDRVQRRRGTTVGKGKVAKNTRAYQELPA